MTLKKTHHQSIIYQTKTKTISNIIIYQTKTKTTKKCRLRKGRTTSSPLDTTKTITHLSL